MKIKILLASLMLTAGMAFGQSQFNGGQAPGATITGAPTAGHCVEWFSATQIEDSGAGCNVASGFNSITTGSNTTATMTVGTGGTLTFSGSGVVNASTLQSATWASPAAIGSNTPAAASFTSLSAATLAGAAFQNLTLGYPLMGGGTNTITATPMAISIAAICGATAAGNWANCPNQTDESHAIQVAVTNAGCGRYGGCHVVDDMCGTQTWSVQPFYAGSAATTLTGLFEFRSICSSSYPHVVSIDGIDSVEQPMELWVWGQSTSEFAAIGTSGNVLTGGSYIRSCNPVIYTCLHGGQTIQQSTIATSVVSTNTMLVTMTAGTPFSNSVNNINAVRQYRMLHIAGASSCVTTNAAWMISAFTQTTTPQEITVEVPAAVTGCASGTAGTAYLETPLWVLGVGNQGGVFGTRLGNVTLDCSYTIGCEGFVQGLGEEMSGIDNVQVFNSTMFYGRVDESGAFAGLSAGSTNSGPYGPWTGNEQVVTCSISGGCGCMGNSTGCSSSTLGTPGTVANGTLMSVGASGTFATISPDPAINGNFVCFIGTGASGLQGDGRVQGHTTCSIADKSAGGGSPVPGLENGTSTGNIYGAGGIVGTTIGTAFGVFGTHMEWDDTHCEYFLICYSVGGDIAKSATYWLSYTAQGIITSGVSFDGGFSGPQSTGYLIDIGSSIADINLIGDIDFSNINVGTGAATLVNDNVTGNICKSFGSIPGSDYVISYYLGHSASGQSQTNGGMTGLATPYVHTTCQNMAQLEANAFSVPLKAGATIAKYGVPVKIYSSTSNEVTSTTTGDVGAYVVVGVTYQSVTAGNLAQVVTTGIVPMIFDTAGTGNCTFGTGQVVVVGTSTAGHVQCVTPPTITSCATAYAAGCPGSIIGVPLQTESTTNTVFNVLVGLR
jgi:hypothetical protein